MAKPFPLNYTMMLPTRVQSCTVRTAHRPLAIVHLSDTHTVHPNLDQMPHADVLVVSGDFLQNGVRFGMEELSAFRHWWMKCGDKYQYRILTCGNHEYDVDKQFPGHEFRDHLLSYEMQHHPNASSPDWEREFELRRDRTFVLFDDYSGIIEIEGVTFYGSPWTLDLDRDQSFQLRSSQLEEKFAEIPRVDVLITHSPPANILDLAFVGPDFKREHWGSPELSRTVIDNPDRRPLAHLFGHVHDGAGLIEQDGIVFSNGCYNRDVPFDDRLVNIVSIVPTPKRNKFAPGGAPPPESLITSSLRSAPFAIESSLYPTVFVDNDRHDRESIMLYEKRERPNQRFIATRLEFANGLVVPPLISVSDDPERYLCARNDTLVALALPEEKLVTALCGHGPDILMTLAGMNKKFVVPPTATAKKESGEEEAPPTPPTAYTDPEDLFLFVPAYAKGHEIGKDAQFCYPKTTRSSGDGWQPWRLSTHIGKSPDDKGAYFVLYRSNALNSVVEERIVSLDTVFPTHP